MHGETVKCDITKFLKIFRRNISVISATTNPQ